MAQRLNQQPAGIAAGAAASVSVSSGVCTPGSSADQIAESLLQPLVEATRKSMVRISVRSIDVTNTPAASARRGSGFEERAAVRAASDSS